MRSPILAALTLAGLALPDAPVLAQRWRTGGPAAARNGWVFSLTEGRRLAEKSGRPLMVVLRCEP